VAGWGSGVLLIAALWVQVSFTVKNLHNSRCVTVRDEERFSVAQFLQHSVIIRDIVGRFGHTCMLTRDELTCIVHHLATM